VAGAPAAGSLRLGCKIKAKKGRKKSPFFVLLLSSTNNCPNVPKYRKTNVKLAQQSVGTAKEIKGIAEIPLLFEVFNGHFKLTMKKNVLDILTASSGLWRRGL
jgi:hypothetical protein